MSKILTEKEFIELLKERGLLPDQEFDSFRQASAVLNWNLPEVEQLFKEFGFTFVKELPPQLLSSADSFSVPPPLLKKERLFPLSEREGVVLVATDNPFNSEGLSKLEWILGKPVKPVVVPYDLINSLVSLQQEEEELGGEL